MRLLYIYGKEEEWPPSFFDYVVEQFNSFDNYNFFLRRKKAYNPVGRNQTFQEAKDIGEYILKTMVTLGVPCIMIDADANAAQKIFDIIK